MLACSGGDCKEGCEEEVRERQRDEGQHHGERAIDTDGLQCAALKAAANHRRARIGREEEEEEEVVVVVRLMRTAHSLDADDVGRNN